MSRSLIVLITITMASFTHAVQGSVAPGQGGSPETIEQLLRGSDAFSEPQSLEQDKVRWARSLWQSLDRKTGRVELAEGVAVLEVPESFYYLSGADAQKVLVKVWGNPPGGAAVGMLLPAGLTPFDDASWGVLLEYSEEGYVSDENAAEIDYDAMLADMQADTRAASQQRVKAGYPEMELLGWAQRPYYDEVEKKLHWAKEVRFGGVEQNTLNYNIRVLGRKGVLSMNFVADMQRLDVINANLDAVLAMIEFSEGHRYADFDPQFDKVAAYGIGALVAGKVIAKAGVLMSMLLIFKKFWFVLLVPLPALLRRFIFSRASAKKSVNKDK